MEISIGPQKAADLHRQMVFHRACSALGQHLLHKGSLFIQQ